jgi:LysR family transcriptional regulator, nitrogen assimilation regulatory protein
MDEHQLRCFLAIAELGSVSRAAARIDIAQPTLSTILLRLEDEVGVRLFNRGSRGVAATEAGRIFQEHARNILKAMQRARDEIRQPDSFAATTVSVGLPSSLSMLVGARLVVAARERLGGVALYLGEALSGHIRDWLEKGEIELAILHEVDALRHLSVRRLGTEEIFLIGPPDRFGPPDRLGVAPGEIPFPGADAQPLILPGRRHALRQFVDRTALARGSMLEVAIEIDSLPHIKTLIAAGHGYSILSHATVRDELAAGRLSAIRFAPPTLERAFYLVRNPGHVVTRASVGVEDLLVTMLRDMVADGTWLARWAGPDLPPAEP